MKRQKSKNRHRLLIVLILVSVLYIPCISFGIEPFAAIGQPSPEKHAFLTNNTLIRILFNNSKIQIVERETGEIIDELDIRPEDSYVVISPDVEHLAFFQYTSDVQTTTVSIWDINAGQKINMWKVEQRGYGYVEFSPTEPILVCSSDNQVHLWNWQTGEIVAIMVGERRPLNTCYIVEKEDGKSISKTCGNSVNDNDFAFTPDGKYLIVASRRSDIELWSMETRELLGHFEGHNGTWVDGLAMSPDGKYLASYENGDNLVYLWDVATRQLIWTKPIDEHGISAIEFSPDGQHLYVAHQNVYILNVNVGQQVDSFGNDYRALQQMVLSPDGKSMLLQYDSDYISGGIVELWDVETRHIRKVFNEFVGGVPRLSPDGNTLVSIESNFLKVWDIPTQQVRFHKHGLFFFERTVAISSDNKRLAYSKYPGIEIVNLQSGNVEVQYQDYVGFLADAAFSQSGRWFVGVDSFGYLRLWDLIDPNIMNRIFIELPLEKHYFERVAFSENDTYFAVYARTGANVNNKKYWIVLWKRQGVDFSLQYKWEIEKQANSLYPTLDFNTTEDGTTVLATAGKTGTQIWKILPKNAQLISKLAYATTPIQFIPDKRYLFTSGDRELQIWDWQRSRIIKYPSIPYFGGISDDGSILVSLGKSRQYLIWDAESMFSALPYSVEPKDKLFVTLGQIKRNQLLQNYPNPFNPETWIPFRLADESEVTIDIYNSTGDLIRTLSPGTMKAGDYTAQLDAVHWDGKNDDGELVSSGIYYYTINADDFSATRKMLIRK